MTQIAYIGIRLIDQVAWKAGHFRRHFEPFCIFEPDVMLMQVNIFYYFMLQKFFILNNKVFTTWWQIQHAPLLWNLNSLNDKEPAVIDKHCISFTDSTPSTFRLPLNRASAFDMKLSLLRFLWFYCYIRWMHFNRMFIFSPTRGLM
jgi:hypothetical protein